ncbi:hypothetical protein P5V15_007096 [Pogonomyrmex californicus]
MERKKTTMMMTTTTTTTTTTTMMTAMLSYMSKDMKNDNVCGTCFWTMSESACASKLWMLITKTYSLNNLDADNTMRCGYHYTNCALQNVFKLFNWWSDNHE